MFNSNSLNRLTGIALRTGVFLALILMLSGGIGHLVHHAQNESSFAAFKVSKVSLLSVLQGVRRLDTKAIVYLGVVVLIATPILRVLLSLINFIVQKDRLYIVITLIVLSVITFSILSGQAA